MIKNFPHLIDIELTNRCNALCFFCPRDKTPQQGMISQEHFEKVIERALTLPHRPRLSLTGQGEPTLHPKFSSFIQHAKQMGFDVATTSNGSQLSDEISREIINSGLNTIHFSVSDLSQTYEQVYNLDFESVINNIDNFIKINEGKVEIVINIVKHELNSHYLEEIRSFWRNRGVDRFLEFAQNNRGGACDNGHEFIGNSRFLPEATQIMEREKLSSICPAAFLYLFVGWNGNYYICCNDYQKSTILGNIMDTDLEKLEHTKFVKMAAGIQACQDCNIDPTNKIREQLFEIERGVASPEQLDKTIHKMRLIQDKLPPEFHDIEWKSHYLEASNIIIKSPT